MGDLNLPTLNFSCQQRLPVLGFCLLKIKCTGPSSSIHNSKKHQWIMTPFMVVCKTNRADQVMCIRFTDVGSTATQSLFQSQSLAFMNQTGASWASKVWKLLVQEMSLEKTGWVKEELSHKGLGLFCHGPYLVWCMPACYLYLLLISTFAAVRLCTSSFHGCGGIYSSGPQGEGKYSSQQPIAPQHIFFFLSLFTGHKRHFKGQGDCLPKKFPKKQLFRF